MLLAAGTQKPHTFPAFARGNELDAGAEKRLLNRDERAVPGVDGTPLQSVHRVERDNRAISQVLLRPAKQGAGSSYLGGSDHPDQHARTQRPLPP